MADTDLRSRSLSACVAEEIRAMMGRRRFTGAALARELGVSQMWVSDRLRDMTPITLNDLERIAKILDVDVVDLLPERAPRHRVGSPVTGRYAVQVSRPPARAALSRPTSGRDFEINRPSGPRRPVRVSPPIAA